MNRSYAKGPNRMDEAMEKLEKGVQGILEGDQFKEYLKTMSRFSSYSFNNIVLIHSQRPDATLVAGYKAWQTKFGRQVKKGEKGIQIIVPTVKEEEREVIRRDPGTHEVIRDANGEPVRETRKVRIPRYHTTTVFDVSQTEGRELPRPPVEQLQGEVPRFADLMEALRRISPVPVSVEPLRGIEANGFYDGSERKIVVRSGMSENQTLKTSLHELAHAIMHDRQVLHEKGIYKDTNTRELEAESVAFVVGQSFGQDFSDYSFGYIASWLKEQDPGQLRESMDTVRKNAARITGAMRTKLLEITAERKLSELAARVDDVIYRYDMDAYRSAFEERQESVTQIRKDLEGGTVRDLREELDIIRQDRSCPELAALAAGLLGEIPEPPPVTYAREIRYFVAENMRLPVAGQYRETDSLKEAKAFYDGLPEKAVKGGGGIGAILQNSRGMRTDVPLLVGGDLRTEIRENDLFREVPGLAKALEDLGSMVRTRPEPVRTVPAAGKGEWER